MAERKQLDFFLLRYVPDAVRFPGDNREIREFSVYFGGRGADFLCSADCVAEGEGFELRVQVLRKPLRALVSLTYA
jgi:hypothetical protein